MSDFIFLIRRRELTGKGLSRTRSGFKISDHVREQGAGRWKSAAYIWVCEHFEEICDAP